MRMVIDHNLCDHAAAFSDRCLSATIRNPLGHERYCMAEMHDDGRPELTVTLRFDDQEHTLVLEDPEAIRAAALEGWAASARPE